MVEMGKKAIHIVRFSCITQPATAAKDIGELWGKFFNSAIKEKLGVADSAAIFSVYSDYENEEKGHYRTTIGYAIDDFKKIPNDLGIVTLPAGKYQTYKVKSRAVENIVSAWQAIWATLRSMQPRNFIADCEVYEEDKATIYIGY